MTRIIVLIGAGLLLASCTNADDHGLFSSFGKCPGYGACTGRTMASPYDTSDNYLDAQGHPIPGMANMRGDDIVDE